MFGRGPGQSAPALTVILCGKYIAIYSVVVATVLNYVDVY